MDELWYKDAVFYEVYVRAFKDSNGDGQGDLRGLASKLDYLKELGVDCLWLLPICQSPLVDDGYDVSDYRRLLPEYGDVMDFQYLVQEAHARGIRVITDLIMNHTSDQHPWFVESRSSRSSVKRDYYLWSATDQRFHQARVIFVDTQKSNWQFDPATSEFYFHRFYPQQPDLNYDNPLIQQGMIDIMRFWLDLGIDGFRCDAVPYLFKREGTNCENLPETHAYLKRARAFVSDHYAGKILLGEANQWPREAREYFGNGDEFQMAFHFPLMPRIFMSLASEDHTPILATLNQAPPIPETCQWCIFLRNHDELTLEMVTEQERERMWNVYAPEPRMRLNLGIRRRLAPLLDNNRRKIEMANSILFTMPGSPIIYYGDEIGMGDNIWLDDRDGVRTPMQWTNGENAGFSDADATLLYEPPIRDAVYGYTKVNVQAEQADPSSLWNAIRHMIAVRKEHRAFGRGNLNFLLTENTAILAYLREHQGEVFLVVNNLSSQRQEAVLALPGFQGITPIDLMTDTPQQTITSDAYRLRLSPYEYLWLSLNVPKGQNGPGNSK
ncbi:MAG: maltose alpha-D-glucosyltransferase [Chloroflexi bacterium]|nr:maltose alpha-D-glucosyltransferase [Chloroflexota bacterium]